MKNQTKPKKRKNAATFEVDGQLIRRCTKCKTEKPLTSDNFSIHADMSYGFRYWCKLCTAQKHSDNVNRVVTIPDNIQCRKCQQTKPQNQFGSNKRNAFKKEYNCKDCNREIGTKRYNKLVANGVTRTCHTCKTEKPVLDFHRNNTNRMGVSARCKKCDNIKTSAQKRHKIATDVNAALVDKLRSRIYKSIKAQSTTKAKKSIELLGAEIPVVRKYLEDQFQEGMTWDNHGTHGWHIDHIIPISSFDLTDPIQQVRCFHYTNLQPLWAADNLFKSGKIL